MLATELEGHGFQVLRCADGQQAIDHLQAQRPPTPDLVLTDFQMPQADGLAVLTCAREHAPWLPVVLAVGSAAQSDAGDTC